MTEKEPIDTINALIDAAVQAGTVMTAKDIARRASERLGEGMVAEGGVADLADQVFAARFEPWKALPGAEPRLREVEGVARVATMPRGANQHTEISACSQSAAAEPLNVSPDSIQFARKVATRAPAPFRSLITAEPVRPMHSPLQARVQCPILWYPMRSLTGARCGLLPVYLLSRPAAA